MRDTFKILQENHYKKVTWSAVSDSNIDKLVKFYEKLGAQEEKRYQVILSRKNNLTSTVVSMSHTLSQNSLR